MGGLWSTAQSSAVNGMTPAPPQQWGQAQYAYPPAPPGYVYASAPPQMAYGWQPQPSQPQFVPMQPGLYPQMVQPGQQPYVYHGQSPSSQPSELAISGVSSVADPLPRHVKANR